MNDLLGHTYAGAGGKRTIKGVEGGYVYWFRPGKPVRRSPVPRFMRWLKAAGAVEQRKER
jgi:hypothetical protein